MQANSKIIYAFYGDDFTGSTDALEAAVCAGANAVLFIEPPSADQLVQFPQLDTIGVAGKTRALPPEEMEAILLPAFRQLKASGAKHVQYKVCSTFDASPATGSIGKAIDCGAAVFKNNQVPVLGGNPALGRYCLFGNLFARMGIGSNGAVYRLDRHPSMSRHPVTPADESDLRVHLSRQTTKRIALIDVLQLSQPVNEWISGTEELVLIDTLDETQLVKIGEWMDTCCYNGNPLFSTGSSAVAAALGSYWQATGEWQKKTSWDELKPATPLLVVSGSCSPVTAAQVAWAKAHGFEEIVIDIAAVTDNQETGIAAAALHTLLREQKNVIVHTGTVQTQNLPSQKIGMALGRIALAAAENTGIKRIVISGGDTSSYAARAMEIDAVAMIAPLVSGAPLCRAFSKNACVNGLEVNFKGGQVGTADYFGILQKGKL